MSYVIQTSKDFEKGIKHLAKRYRSIVSDYEQFLNSLEENPFRVRSCTPASARFVWPLLRRGVANLAVPA